MMVNIGFGNIISSERVVAMVAPESAPVKRLMSEARQKGLLIVDLRQKDQGGHNHRQRARHTLGHTAGDHSEQMRGKR